MPRHPLDPPPSRQLSRWRQESFRLRADEKVGTSTDVPTFPDVPTCGDVPTFLSKSDVPTFWYRVGDVPTFYWRPHLLGLGATVGTVDFTF